jgi:hypothetical protein
MRNFLFVMILLCLSALPVGAQNLQNLIDAFDEVVRDVPEKISTKSLCDNLLESNEEVRKNILKVLEQEEDYHPEDIKNLRYTIKQSEALDDFIRTVGNHSYIPMYITDAKLDAVKEFLDFEMVEINSGMFCCKLFECRIGNYISVLAYKSGSGETFNIVADISSGNTATRMNMGLFANKYRKLWSGKTRVYKVTAVQCSKTGDSFFN